MDGTLTLAVHDFDHIRTLLGIESGIPILEAIDAMPVDRAEKLMQELFDIEMDIAAGAKPQPGAIELLEHLIAQNYSIGILTRNSCAIAHTTLEASGLHHYFDVKTILGRESCAPKPSPAGIQLLLSQWQAPPSESVMVGDYKFDLEAGHQAGTHTVHLDVNNGEQWPDLTTARVSTLNELRNML